MDTETPCPSSTEQKEVDPPSFELIEGLHYYLDDGLVVFSEAYHRTRGYCCGSGCRHCPYDHVKVE